MKRIAVSTFAMALAADDPTIYIPKIRHWGDDRKAAR